MRAHYCQIVGDLYALHSVAFLSELACKLLLSRRYYISSTQNMGLASSELVIWVQANDATHLLYHVVVESKQRPASTCHVAVGTWELTVNFSFGYG
jgi:hypothetical protein